MSKCWKYGFFGCCSLRCTLWYFPKLKNDTRSTRELSFEEEMSFMALGRAVMLSTFLKYEIKSLRNNIYPHGWRELELYMQGETGLKTTVSLSGYFWIHLRFPQGSMERPLIRQLLFSDCHLVKGNRRMHKSTILFVCLDTLWYYVDFIYSSLFFEFFFSIRRVCSQERERGGKWEIHPPHTHTPRRYGHTTIPSPLILNS